MEECGVGWRCGGAKVLMEARDGATKKEIEA